MDNAGIKFMPLYWVYHDSWINRTWSWNYWTGWTVGGEQRHRGHMHLFMPDYPIKDTTQKGQAYSGRQTYSFSLESLWGPNSGDPNQADNTEYVGTPKWYFEVTEYWRRIYIQPWDDHDANSKINGFVGRAGIKYDAADPDTTYGPFREGRDFFFFYDQGARALPIEYFKDEEKKYRDNVLSGSDPYEIPNYDNDKYEAKQSKFFIPKGGFVDRPMEYYLGITSGGVSPEQAERGKEKAKELGATYHPPEGTSQGYYTYSDDFGAYQQSFNDLRYIHPIIEYQKLVHLEWERLPGWEERDRDNGGDGFSISVSLPYEKNGVVQSPFSDDNGYVAPAGTYYHGFEEKYPEKVLRYPKYDKCDIGWYQWRIVRYITDEEGNQQEELIRIELAKEAPKDLPEGEHVSGYLTDEDGDPKWGRNPDPSFDEWRTPDELKGQKVAFRVPENMRSDGVWVEQCLGGVVRAKAVIMTRDNFGEVKTHEVTTTKFFLNELFEGADQNGSTES